MKLSSLSILIPAYKDEKTIATVVAHAQHIGKQVAKKLEIVVINDASPDKTGIVIEKLKKQIPELHVIHHIINQGYGGTIKELYFAGNYEWLFTVPGDYQIDPKEIQKMLPYTASFDMIIGWRKKRSDNQNRLRQSKIYNMLLRLMFGLRLHDINSVRLMKRSIMHKRKFSTNSSFVDAELTIGAIHDGYQVIEIPIQHLDRKTGGASGGKWSIIMPVIIDMLRYRLHSMI
ncbi:MAG: glycosyltransferase family 2 protein [Candidatus Gottesmanbacteria bacterium]